MSLYEVEIKTLLGAPEHAEALKLRMAELDPSCVMTSRNSQLNHYFFGGDITELVSQVSALFHGDAQDKLAHIAEKGNSFSVRTRQKDDTVLLVVKASVDEGTSENTVTRMEFEEPVSISLDELDARVLDAGYAYQAKWSRDREEYAYRGINVCLDRNAGYGYLAEFEKMVADETLLSATRADLMALMAELGVSELPQDRLARMFDHYNQHWAEYYGTDKTFTIE